jgi:hypothetical protein
MAVLFFELSTRYPYDLPERGEKVDMLVQRYRKVMERSDAEA